MVCFVHLRSFFLSSLVIVLRNTRIRENINRNKRGGIEVQSDAKIFTVERRRWGKRHSCTADEEEVRHSQYNPVWRWLLFMAILCVVHIPVRHEEDMRRTGKRDECSQSNTVFTFTSFPSSVFYKDQGSSPSSGLLLAFNSLKYPTWCTGITSPGEREKGRRLGHAIYIPSTPEFFSGSLSYTSLSLPSCQLLCSLWSSILSDCFVHRNRTLFYGECVKSVCESRERMLYSFVILLTEVSWYKNFVLFPLFVFSFCSISCSGSRSLCSSFSPSISLSSLGLVHSSSFLFSAWIRFNWNTTKEGKV